MKKAKSYPIKTVYYESENDEFSSAVITPRKIDESYKYIRRAPLWQILRFISYRLIATPIAFVFCKIKLALKVKRRDILSDTLGEGIFVFANHTQETADAFIPSLALFPRSVYAVVHPNNVSMPFLGKITPYLGAIPTPTTHRAVRNFENAIEKRLLEGAAVVIYPEAHIWPYYNKIRSFPPTSMTYPVRYNAPSYTMTTVYKKRNGGRPPRAETVLDGPFYPDMSLPARERAAALREVLYKAMCKRSLEGDCEYIRYISTSEKQKKTKAKESQGNEK